MNDLGERVQVFDKEWPQDAQYSFSWCVFKKVPTVKMSAERENSELQLASKTEKRTISPADCLKKVDFRVLESATQKCYQGPRFFSILLSVTARAGVPRLLLYFQMVNI